MENYPLFTVGMLAYKNYRFIKDALKSVLMQDYPNIELIISNDGSDDFDEEDLISYLNKHRTTNITQIVINNNEKNLGTVKNVNFVRSKAKGVYLMLIAADDALFDGHVLSRFVDEFERLGSEAYIISAQTAMCGQELTDIKAYEPDKEGIRAIKEFSPEQMFSRLSHTFTIPTTSSCYRMSLYDRIGEYDEDYFLIEDAPLYIKMARLGYKFHWIDNMVAALHRDGGISHGNTNNLFEAYRRYRHDEIVMYKKEILPYKKQILPNDYKKMMVKWKYLDRAYFQKYLYPQMPKLARMKYALKNWPFLLREFLKRIRDIVFDVSLTKDFEKASLFTLLLYGLFILGAFRPIMPDIEHGIFVYVTGIFSIALFGVLILLYFTRLIYRCYCALKYILTGKGRA